LTKHRNKGNVDTIYKTDEIVLVYGEETGIPP